jgi:TolB-like protein/DNA-binding winged helix-turn-helix (wHTH) protein
MPAGDANKTFRVGNWLVQPDLNRLSDGDQVVTVEPRVMAVLVCLASRPGKIVKADEFMETVWHGRAHADDTIYQAVANLRKALGDDTQKPRYIETIAKKGYRLIGPVTAAATDSDMPDSTPLSSNGQRQRRRKFDTQSHYFLSTISLLLVTGFLFLSSSDVSTHYAPNTYLASQVNSIAVLPFIDMSGGGDQDYLGDGIADEVLHTLTNIADMRVVARTSSFAMRGLALDVRDIGERLNVDAVLEGSIRNFGDRIRITVQLIHADTGYHIWSQRYDRTFSDVLAIQDEIAVSVARALRPDFRVNRQLATTNLEAYDQYLLGKHQMNKRRPENLERALEHFQNSIDLDPEFALAYANLSWAYQLAATYGPLGLSEEHVLKASETAAHKAIELDDSLAEAWTALFHVYSWKLFNLDSQQFYSIDAKPPVGDNWAKELANAKRAMFRAMELNPNSAFVNRGYAHYLGLTKRIDDVFRQHLKLVELDPLSAVDRMNLSYGYFDRGQFDKADNEIKIAVELEPGWHITWNAGALFFFQMGRLDEAIKWQKEAIKIKGPNAEPVWAWRIADAYLTLGDYASAEAWMSRSLKLNKPRWWIYLQRIQMYLAQASDLEAHDVLTAWLTRIPGDDFCCHRSEMLLTVADAINFGALVEMLVGHDDHAADLYNSAMALPREQQHYDSDINNLFGHDALVSWGYLPAVNQAHLYQRVGQIDEADQLLDQSINYLDEFDAASLRNTPRQQVFPGNHYVRASIFSLRGEKKEALAAFRMAVSSGWNRAWYARRDPNMEGLRDDPEFQAILQDIDSRLVAMRERMQLANVARH